jgi:hypothetical protein
VGDAPERQMMLLLHCIASASHDEDGCMSTIHLAEAGGAWEDELGHQPSRTQPEGRRVSL